MDYSQTILFKSNKQMQTQSNIHRKDYIEIQSQMSAIGIDFECNTALQKHQPRLPLSCLTQGSHLLPNSNSALKHEEEVNRHCFT